MSKNKQLDALNDEQVLETVARCGSINKASAYLKVPRSTLQLRCTAIQKRYVKRSLPKPVAVPAPKRGKRSFIFSSAQNGTQVHEPFLDNLEAYAKHLKAELHIAGFTYNKSLFEDHSKDHSEDFHPRVEKYLTNRRYDIVGKLLFCGEMNTLPTATDPLGGFEAYTMEKWGIFPHPRVQLKSIATMFNAPPKIIMTTGAVTHKNYVQKKAGIKSEFHHVFGAVLVEIDDDGDFFCRHLLAEKDGSFQDLTTRVDHGKVTEGHSVEAITWGDIHAERLDPKTATGSWGVDENSDVVPGDPTTILDALRPKVQFFHDVIDFRRRNHHNIDDPHHMFEMWINGTESVEGEIGRVAKFLAMTRRPFCKSVVVDSNHDRALKRWLKKADYRKDPINARFFLECQAAVYKSIEDQDAKFLLAEWAIRHLRPDLGSRVQFLHNTDSFVICPQAGGGIECALHGDLGSNGAKGFINTFARMGPKAIIAHHHGAAIFEGIWQVGHSCKRDMVYNRGGLSSWNPSHIATLPSGKRQMITMRGTKYRA